MQLTTRRLNRATLDRQSLLVRADTDAASAIRGAVAVQAQSPVSPYIGLWNRVAGFDPADLDAAYADRRVLRGNPVRMTLHAVAADEYRPFREATEPSLYAAKLGGRIAKSGITGPEAAALADDLFAALFADGEVRTARECEDWLAGRLGPDTAKQVWPGIRQYAPLLRVPTGGPWSFADTVSYAALPDQPTLRDPDAADAALATLVRRHIEGFGPVAIADVAQFAMVQRARVKQAVATLDLELYQGPNGEVLYDLPGAALPDEDVPAPPRLMAMWDNVFLAFHDRGRTVPPDYRTTLIRNNGDVLPMLLVDGFAAGVWRTVEGGIEATAFHPLPDDVWDALAAEAKGLTALLADREPDVYRRHRHWWDKLPDHETVLLPGS
ncbi:Winged helix DNA-binding domain-containing protein [Glycomyces sambucus]|uniref:Winged helix DNA-binding domain-containing protein n=1 Tax=Glycomyces sambucus TaxID=380244 RepID=A0A1G9K6V9_9ACTN|nr:winged helix DNA-binding domain-containing protein [Glycomyces sambucus]SDL45266.1 Winged helix DNA-binding domain-containing protein [Glycomyces sambucus]